MMNTRFNNGVSAFAGLRGFAKSVPIGLKAESTIQTILGMATRTRPHPFWNGTQNCDLDLADMRFSKMNTSWGKNFVENKMPEAHWKLESYRARRAYCRHYAGI